MGGERLGERFVRDSPWEASGVEVLRMVRAKEYLPRGVGGHAVADDLVDDDDAGGAS
jgi:hypothetical protein